MDGLAEAIAEQLLVRWGIVFRDVVLREELAVPWREVVWAMRRLEARGVIRGGRFVSGFTGEQFALPEALDELARVRRQPRDGERVRICGSDPLNLVGILTPGARVSAVRTREIIFVDGLPTSLEDTESARIAKATPVNVQANVITRLARASGMATAISAGTNQGTSAETNGLPKAAANTATKTGTNTQEDGAERPVSSTQMELR
jgi:hypothetical protein